MQQLIQMQFDFSQRIVVLDDPNRQLMIKFKYDKISDEQLQLLRKQLHKLIFDIIRKNYVKLDCRDVYQQIWRKIIKSKHSWNQNMGTKVSTWIVWVCLSVINGLRLKQKKYADRYSLYQDLIQQEQGVDKYECVLFNSGLVDQKPLQKMCFTEQFAEFISGLNEVEKDIIDMVLQTEVDQMNKQRNNRYKKKKITKGYIKNKLNLKQKQFYRIMEELKRKFRQKIVKRG